MRKIKRAVISVWDKTHLVELAKFLSSNNIEIISTGGTKEILEKSNIPVRSVSSLTKQKEIMDGRIKTIHPNLFGGILADRSNKNHVEDLNQIDSKLIDLVVINLYPFRTEAVEKKLELEKSIEFIDISSYVGMSRGELILNKDINFNVKNKNILIVEDIVDSGNTINFLFEYINDKKPKSLKIATLFFKPEAYNFNMKIDWIGFNISNEFIVGYGLDHNEIYRNRKSIYILEDE